MDVVSRDEEASEKHEWNDQDRRERHSELFVRERGRDDQRVSGGGIVDEDEDHEEDNEGIEGRVVADSVVDDAAVDHWSHDREWKLRDNLGPEVRTDIVHIVVNFSEEYRSFVWENQDDVLDGVEGNVHRHKEEGSLHVLDALHIMSGVEEEQDSEQSSQARRKKLHVRGLRQSKQVEEVSSAKETELVEEAGLDGALVGGTLVESLEAFVGFLVVVLQVRVQVRCVEVLDDLLVLGLNGLFVDVASAGLRGLVKLNALDGHHRHEVVGWVAQFGARVANLGEVVNCPAGFVEVNDFSTGEEHKAVEHFVDVGVRLMDRTDNGTVLIDGQVAKDFHH